MIYTFNFDFDYTKTYEIYPQIKFVDKLTSELDIFELTLKPLEKELDLDFKKYNGFIPIVLRANGEVFKRMYLTYYKCVNTEHNPVNYKYLFQCVSPTFKLQRITLPNKLITQPITDEKRTVWEELNKIMEVYAPKIYIEETLQEKLNVPCPELQFVKSTLHEVLITLFAVCGLVPKMEKFNFLSFIDLKSYQTNKKWLSEDLFIRIEKENNIQSYADALDYDIENAIDNKDFLTTTWMTPTSDEILVTKDNFVWKTPTDIYDIIKVEAKVKTYYGLIPNAPTYQNVTVDITSHVVPKEIWETFKTSVDMSLISGKYKRNYLYYENNTINGNYDEGSFLGFSSDKAIKYAVYWCMKQNPLYSEIDINSFTPYRDILLKITYKPKTNNTRVKIIKTGIARPENSLISNQEESYIDIVNFGKQKQELIDRTGNELTRAQARFDLSKYENLNKLNIANLGDVVDENYIITEREMQFKENSLLVNYKMAKDYVYETGYSGLNQVKRFTSIDTKNTLVRNDNFIKVFKLSKNGILDNRFMFNFLINNYGKKNENGVDMHFVKTFGKNEEALQDYFILVNSQNKIISDNIICSFGFDSNVKVGDSVIVSGDKYLKEPITYADKNGEFKELQFYFGQAQYLRNENDLDVIRKFPKVENTHNLENMSFLINKDNREVTSITLQIKVVGDDDVFVYEDFIKHTQITKRDENVDLKVYCKYYKNENDYLKNKYNEFSKEVQGEEVTTATITFENNKIKISGVGDMNYYACVGIVADGKLIIGVNFLLLSAIPTLELFMNYKYFD